MATLSSFQRGVARGRIYWIGLEVSGVRMLRHKARYGARQAEL